MKKDEKNKKTYSENQVMVILEDMRSQFMVFGEGQNLLSEKVNDLDLKVNDLNLKVDNLDLKVDNLDLKVDSMDEKLVRIEDDVVEIKHKLSEKVDLKDFQKLEKRLIKLEKIVLEKI